MRHFERIPECGKCNVSLDVTLRMPFRHFREFESLELIDQAKHSALKKTPAVREPLCSKDECYDIQKLNQHGIHSLFNMASLAWSNRCRQLSRIVWRYLQRTWEQCQAFDEDSRYQLTATGVPRITRLQQLLAYTIYNPTVCITSAWTRTADRLARRHSLVVAFQGRVAPTDDAILTQWFRFGRSDAAYQESSLFLGRDSACRSLHLR
jgi:hypothetical protein